MHSAVGHYDLMFAVLPPLIVDAALRLAAGTGRAGARRARCGRAGAGRARGRPTAHGRGTAARLGPGHGADRGGAGPEPPAADTARVRGALPGLRRGRGAGPGGVRLPAVGPVLRAAPQHGSPFAPDFFKNDLAGFVTPSKLCCSTPRAAPPPRPGTRAGLSEYLAYLGWPLLLVLAVIAVGCWRQLPVRAAAVTFAVLAIFSLGGTLMIGGVSHPGILLPWHWLSRCRCWRGAAGPVRDRRRRRRGRAAGVRRRPGPAPALGGPVVPGLNPGHRDHGARGAAGRAPAATGGGCGRRVRRAGRRRWPGCTCPRAPGSWWCRSRRPRSPSRCAGRPSPARTSTSSAGTSPARARAARPTSAAPGSRRPRCT